MWPRTSTILNSLPTACQGLQHIPVRQLNMLEIKSPSWPQLLVRTHTGEWSKRDRGTRQTLGLWPPQAFSYFFISWESLFCTMCQCFPPPNNTGSSPLVAPHL